MSHILNLNERPKTKSKFVMSTTLGTTLEFINFSVVASVVGYPRL